jgi:hypothetical protein
MGMKLLEEAISLAGFLGSQRSCSFIRGSRESQAEGGRGAQAAGAIGGYGIRLSQRSFGPIVF